MGVHYYSTKDVRPDDPRLRCVCGAFVVDVLPGHLAHDASGGTHTPYRCPEYSRGMTVRFDLLYGPDWRRVLEDLRRADELELAARRAA